MCLIKFIALTASLSLTVAAAPLNMMGGLPLRVSHGGPFDGLIDTSPLARSEVALRADPRTESVKIVPAGWILTVKSQSAVSSYRSNACATLIKNGIPASAVITIVALDNPDRETNSVCTSSL